MDVDEEIKNNDDISLSDQSISAHPLESFELSSNTSPNSNFERNGNIL